MTLKYFPAVLWHYKLTGACAPDQPDPVHFSSPASGAPPFNKTTQALLDFPQGAVCFSTLNDRQPVLANTRTGLLPAGKPMHQLNNTRVKTLA